MSKLLRGAVAIFLLSVLLLFSPLVSSASGKSMPGKQRAAIEAIGEYMTGHADWAGRLLQKYCYEPSVPAATWQHYPAVRKLAIAYEAAEAVNPGVGGDRLLALLSKALAQQYEAVRKEVSLLSYLKMPVSGQPCLEFRKVEKSVFLSALSYKVRSAIITIADYSTRGPLGSQQQVIKSILKHNPNYSEDEADSFLALSATFEEAMIRAYDSVPATARDALIKEQVAKLVPHNEAVRYEPALKAYMPATSERNSLLTKIRPGIVESQGVVTNNGSSVPPIDLRPTLASTLLAAWDSIPSAEPTTRLRTVSDSLNGQKAGAVLHPLSAPSEPMIFAPANSTLVTNRIVLSGSKKRTRPEASTRSDSFGLSLRTKAVLNEQRATLPIKSEPFASLRTPPRQEARKVNRSLTNRQEIINLVAPSANSVEKRSALSVQTTAIRLKRASTGLDAFGPAPRPRSVFGEQPVRPTFGLDEFIRRGSQPSREYRAPEVYRPTPMPYEPFPLSPVYRPSVGIFGGASSPITRNPPVRRSPPVIFGECPP